jgi:aspartyl-tRNA(Asn)/glutamyl-tRNA(Gln) amidotransferase subunit A
MSEELCYLSASEAVQRFRERSLSPVELMTAVIERAEAVEPSVNAFTFTFFDEAMETARRAEARYAGNGARPRPLEGLPLAIKEEMAVEGQPLTSASLVYSDDVADHTAPLAERAMRAGAIVHARTTCPEFSCAGFTHSRLFGATRNPWNLDYDVGGSSGGSAASLAAGTTTLAGGSDIGGSIRIPSSSCGVVGFKPPYGRVPQLTPFNLDHYCHEGPLARTVTDCALFENVIAGPHPHDIVSLRPKLRIPATLEGIEGWKVALCLHLGDYPLHPDVEANTRAAADALRDAGAIVEEVELPWTRKTLLATAMTHYAAIFGPYVQRVAREHGDLLTRYALKFAEDTIANEMSFYEGLVHEGEIYAALGETMERYRILVCPTLALPALEAGKDYIDGGPVIDGIQMRDGFEHCMTVPFNICSRNPVMSVPSGRSADGVPTGVQIVGRTYDDVSVFRAAAALERVRPWPTGPASIPELATVG